MAKKGGKAKKYKKWLVILGILLVLVTGFTAYQMLSVAGDGKDTGDESGDNDETDSDESGETVPQNLGDAATLTLNSYVGSWGEEGAKTEKYPIYTVMSEDDVAIVNDATANSTTEVVVGSVVDIYGTGATYYLTPLLNFKVETAKEIASLEAYTAAATTDLVITAFDTDENSLTADDHANNSADFAGGNLAASDTESYYLKLEQTGANKNFQLNAICTWILGDEMDDFELVQSGWTEIDVPEKLEDTSVVMYDDINASTSEKGFKHCYQPSKPIMLKENMDTGKLKFVADTDDDNAPTANGDSYFGAVFLDGSYSVDKDGNIKFGSYMDDDTEDPGAVGIDENPDTTWNGLDTAVAIEAQ